MTPNPPATNQAALLRWAADRLDADMERFFSEWPDEPRNSPYALGRKDASSELRRLADVPVPPPAPRADDRAAVLAEDLRYVLGYTGPGHAHEKPGVWDTSGKQCGHCARLAVAQANLAAYDGDPDAVLPAPVDRDAEEHRLALSEALGLGTGAPWDAIHDRITELGLPPLGRDPVARRLGLLAAYRATILTEGADAVFALDYDVMVGEEGDENLGSMREAWDLGTIHAEKLLRRLADEAQQPETRTSWTPGPVALARAAEWARRRQDTAAAIASCPGYEMNPNPCRCPCEGCKHHCAAHNPDVPGLCVAGEQQNETPEAEAQPFTVQVWPLTRVLAEVRCGSQDWSWDEEWADLDARHAETGYLAKLEQQIRANGITMPVLIGTDGRLWDGHHRLRLAVRLGIGYVPVEVVPRADEAQPTTKPETVSRETLAELVRDFLDPDPCSFDHHGYCQAHSWLCGGTPCPHGRAREVLGAIDGEPAAAGVRQDGAQPQEPPRG